MADAQLHYQLHLAMLRPGGLPPLRVTKQVAEDEHSFLWQDLAADARYCFRLAATPRLEAPMTEALLSDEICYSTCGCSANGMPHKASSAGTCSSNCTSCMLWGAALGTILTLAACVLCVHLGWHSYFARQLSVIRQGQHGHRVNGAYSYLTTNEVAAELEPRLHRVESMQAEVAPRPSSVAAPLGLPLGLSTSASADSLGSVAATPKLPDNVGLLSMLEPYPMIDAAAFERQWTRSDGRGCIVSAPLPRASLPSPEETELALTHSGLMCIAAGAVDQMHKSYFAAQLRGSGEWLMLELVVFSDRGIVQGMFRGESDSWLPMLVDHFTAVLSRALGAQFERSST